MPVVENRIAFEMARGLRAFLKVEAGTTRDNTAESMHVSGALKSGGTSVPSVRNNTRLQRVKEALSRIVRKGRAFTPVFKRQRSGHIVNTASAAGLVHPPMMSSYNTV